MKSTQKEINLKWFVLLILVYLPFISFTQNTFVKSTIVTINQDTLHGLIKDKEWEINPSIIEYKKDSSANIQKFSPDEILSFNIGGKAIYESKLVEIDTLPRKNQTAGWDKKPQFKRQQVFLNTIIKGNVSLYLLHDNKGKEHYFIEKEGVTTELLYIRYFEKLNVIKEKKTYIGQLNLYLQDCPKVYPLIKKAKYKRKPLVKIFETYNNCHSDNGITFQKERKEIKYQWGLVLGLTSTKVNFSGHNSSNTEFLNFKPSLNYTVGGALNIAFPRFKYRFSLRNEILYKPYQQSANVKLIQGENSSSILEGRLDLAYLKVNMLGQWKLSSTSNPNGLYFLLGPSVNYAVKTENNTHITSTFFSNITKTDKRTILFFKKLELGIGAGLGYSFNKFTIDTRYEIGNGMNKELGLISHNHTFYIIGKYTF